MVARLSHTGPIYKHENTSVYMNIEKAERVTSVDSTVKALSRCKGGRGAFLALILNHVGDTKYRAILKKHMNLPHNIKYNGHFYSLETYLSNRRQVVKGLRECAICITTSVPDQSQ